MATLYSRCGIFYQTDCLFDEAKAKENNTYPDDYLAKKQARLGKTEVMMMLLTQKEIAANQKALDVLASSTTASAETLTWAQQRHQQRSGETVDASVVSALAPRFK